jgi:glycerol-3-phosphate cytidylyltransferase|tara:strand:- start:639 stop:1094 length:456 start_codon:yes stop_codon:yes gene_type:complete
MKVGFTCSPFDLLHAGHIEMLRECKENCDYLICGINTKPEKKGKFPVQSLMERHMQLSGVKYVDEIIPYENEDDLINLLKLKMPDIRFVGGDYHGKPFTGSNLEMEIFYNNREHPFSSRELKNRVIHWAFDGHHYYSKAEVEKYKSRISHE